MDHNQSNESYQVLLKVSSDISTLSAIQAEMKVRQDEGFKEIRDRVFEFAERLIALEHEVAESKKNIAERTHMSETLRIRSRVDSLEENMQSKADSKLVWWIMGMISTVILTIGTFAIKNITGG